jgi:outer membrane protein
MPRLALKKIFWCLGLWGLTAAGAASAQGKSLAANAVCVLDMQRVVSDSAMGKAATVSLEQDMRHSKERVEGLRAEVLRMRAELEKQSVILSGEALEQKGAQVQRKERELGAALTDMKTEFFRKNNLSVAKVEKETNAVLSELVNGKHCQFVLERGRNFVVYAARRVDVTERVIQALNRRGGVK